MPEVIYNWIYCQSIQNLFIYDLLEVIALQETTFSTSEQFENSNPTVEWRFEHLDGFQWSVGAIDGMQCSGSQSGISRVKGVRFLYRSKTQPGVEPGSMAVIHNPRNEGRCTPCATRSHCPHNSVQPLSFYVQSIHCSTNWISRQHDIQREDTSAYMTWPGFEPGLSALRGNYHHRK
jgi:hypothetical protein